MSENKEKKEKKETAPKKSLTKKNIILISVICVFVIILGTITGFALACNKTYNGVYVAGRSLGGMTQDEATAFLEQRFAGTSPVVTVTAEGKKATLDFMDFGEFDFATTAETAYNSGRNSVFNKIYYFLTPFIEKQLPLEFYIDEEKLSTCLTDFQQSLDNPYAENTYEITEDAVILKTGHGGNVIDTALLAEKIKDAMGVLGGEIEADVTYSEFEGVDIQKFHDEVCTKPEDAKYVNGDTQIIPHKLGYEFSVEEAKKIIGIAQPDTTYTIPIIITYPEITEQKLSGKLFADVIASYTTKYNPNEINRTHNMSLAASKVNGTVVAPGQTFSYNNTVGKRTVSAGYRDAKIFENGRVVDGLAGGICQVSTTIYNAVLYADMEIVERKNHSFAVSYAPMGQDATVVWGAIDFKFRNNTKNPIKLTASVSGGKVTVNILSIKERNFKVDIQNTIVSTKPFETKYVTDETLEEGVEKVVQSGINGATVRSVRTVYENGKTVKTETLPSSYYIPQTKEIAVKNADAVNVGEEETETLPEGEAEGETPPSDIPPESTPEPETTPEPEATPEPPVDSEPAPEQEPSSGEVITSPGTGDLPEQIL